LFTANYRTVQTPYTEPAIHLGPIYIAVAKLIAFAVAMLLNTILWIFLHATDLGKAIARRHRIAMWQC
jgi:branched-chain amino acid transport system permease protein